MSDIAQSQTCAAAAATVTAWSPATFLTCRALTLMSSVTQCHAGQTNECPRNNRNVASTPPQCVTTPRLGLTSGRGSLGLVAQRLGLGLEGLVHITGKRPAETALCRRCMQTSCNQPAGRNGDENTREIIIIIIMSSVPPLAPVRSRHCVRRFVQ